MRFPGPPAVGEASIRMYATRLGQKGQSVGRYRQLRGTEAGPVCPSAESRLQSFKRHQPMIRAARQLSIVRAGSRLMSTQPESRLTATLVENAQQLLASLEVECPTTVVPVVRKALDEKRELYGHTHPSTIASINSLAGLLIVDGKMDEAAPLIRESVLASQVLATGR